MNKLAKVDVIKSLIFELKGQKVMLDHDLAQLYGVPVKRLNEQVRRNINRFPADFMFQLNEYEIDQVVTQNATPSKSRMGGLSDQRGPVRSRSQFATMKRGENIKYLPYAFTRNGVNMLSTVLRSKVAIERSIFIMRAFSVLEEAIGRKKQQLLASPQVMKQLSVHSRAIMRLFSETKINHKQISTLKCLQEELANLIQKIIIASIEPEG